VTSHLNAPHGGKLVDLQVSASRAKEIKEQSRDWPSWDLTPRQICDLEMLCNGSFSPLTGFMGKADYESVCDKMRLANGTLWTMPITLDVSKEFAEKVKKGDHVALRDAEGVMLAVIKVEDMWEPDRESEAKRVFGSTDTTHPTVNFLMNQSKPVYIGGTVECLQLPLHYDYKNLRRTPKELREEFAKLGWTKIVAFQTRNPMHRAHHELTLRAAKEEGANLLIHPAVGMTKPGDVDHYTRVRCYQALMSHYPQNTAMLSLLPIAMRMGGPREAIWHAIIRKNHGCTHLVVGRDHAGPGKDKTGKPFYGPYDAQELFQKNEEELGMKMVDFKQMVYIPDEDKYYPVDEVPKDKKTMDISGTELRDRLARGTEIPNWFSYSNVVKELRRSHPARARQGFTVFFTGLSGSGKSTIANVLLSKLLQLGGRPVTILDGDLVRKNLSSELGFSKEHRNLNIKRIGYVAAEITKHRGIAVCAPIAPYDDIRKEVRAMIQAHGGFILVHVNTSVEECEKRDRKGLYAKARAGIIKEFTGISDPYDVPADAEIVIDTLKLTAEEAAQEIYLRLEKEGYIGAED
jgi:sulfate adenylyltransferase